MVDTKMDREARRLYAAGAKTMSGGPVFVIDIQSPNPWSSEGFTRSPATRSLLSFRERQSATRRTAAAEVAMVHGDPRHSWPRSRPQVFSFRDRHLSYDTRSADMQVPTLS